MTNAAVSFGALGSLRDNRALVLLAYALAGAITLLPLLSVSIPPLIDYPNHLARMHILAFIDTVPALRESYRVDWSLVPNLAMDIVVPPIARLVGVFAAGKLFVAVAMLLPVAGIAALRHVLHGRVGFWPMAGFFFVYNHILIWGFLNYLFTIGLFFLAFAAWIATRHWPARARIPLFAAIATGLFIGHFFAFAVYGLTVVAYELGRIIRARRVLRSATAAGALRYGAVVLGQFAVPAALLLMAPSSGAKAVITYGDIYFKMMALRSPVLAYGGPLDAGALAFVAIVAVWAVVAGGLGIRRSLRVPLAVLLVAALLMPNILLGTWAADMRLPFVVLMLALAAIEGKPRSRFPIMIFATIGVMIFAARVSSVWVEWRAYDRQFAEFRAAAGEVREGAALLSSLPFRRGVIHPYDRRVQDKVFSHLPMLLVIDRSVFTPLLFTNPATQPVHVTAAREALDVPFGSVPDPGQLREGADPVQAAILAETVPEAGAGAYWAFWPDHYDYVVAIDFGALANPVPERLALHARGSFFSIYEVLRRDPE